MTTHITDANKIACNTAIIRIELLRGGVMNIPGVKITKRIKENNPSNKEYGCFITISYIYNNIT